MLLKTPHRLMNEAPAADAGGAGGGALAAAPAPAAAPAAQPAAPATVMGQGAAPAEWSAPDKYLVKNGEEIDWQATARKIDEGRSHLEKRFGSGDLPPADVSGYKLAVPEAHAEALADWDLAGDTKLQEFVTGAHKLGFTQQQLDHVLGAYAGMAAEAKGAAAAAPEQAAEEAASALREVWKDPAEFEQNVGLSFKAGQKLAAKLGVPFDDFNAALGNNPMFLRLAAALAPEMQEDTPAGTQAGAVEAQDFEAQVATLRAEKDSLPAKDTARRQAVQDKINALYEKRYPTQR